jgi:tetratricopeptide (TPR) repeat protein
MRIVLAIILVSISPFSVFAQFTSEVTEQFNEGEYFLNRSDYKEAAFYFRKIVDRYPDNAHFNFKLGECYLNMAGSEALAIPCLEKAVKHIEAKQKYKQKDIAETHAPLHAYFYLGNAYRMGNRLDDAMKAYSTFINSPFYYGNYNVTIVENEIKSCERAKIIQDNPVNISQDLLDTIINTEADEMNPVISQDENTLLFVRRLKFYDAIFLSTRTGNQWSQPVNLNPLIRSDGDMFPSCLSSDGNELYLVKTNGTRKEIWVATRQNTTWTPAVRLNNYINTSAGETSPSISSDGKTLYFVSNRKGGLGGTDIYYSRKENQGWGKARNLGKMINTAFDEESPCIINNDSLLYFSSKGHFSMGGYDIFSTSIAGGKWSDPVNIGYPLNNTSDNTSYKAAQGGKAGYYSRMGMEGSTSEDICHVIFK